MFRHNWEDIYRIFFRMLSPELRPETGVIMPLDTIDQEKSAQEGSRFSADGKGLLPRNSEKITSNPKYSVVTDVVPLFGALELEGIVPTEQYIKEAIVQRTIQLHTPFFNIPTSSERPLEETPLAELPIGYEDKLYNRVWSQRDVNAVFGNKELRDQKLGQKFTAEDTVHFFAHEGSRIRDLLERQFPGYEGIIDKLAATGKIYNSGGELGNVQIQMLVTLNHELGRIVGWLNADASRTPGNESYDLRDWIYKKMYELKVPAKQLISYSGGERQLAIPKIFSHQLTGRNYVADVSNYDTGFIRVDPGTDLSETLRRVSENEQRDWKLLRNAAFLMNDPLVRVVLDTYDETKYSGSTKSSRLILDRYVEEARNTLKSRTS
jgi:hypothetical protein